MAGGPAGDHDRHLLRLRREHPVLRQDRFFAGRPVHSDGTKDLAWFGPDGVEMNHERWHDPGCGCCRCTCTRWSSIRPSRRRHHTDESLLVVLQGVPEPVQVRLPGAPWATAYRLLWDSALERPPDALERPRR